MIGHACDACGATMAECDVVIRTEGRGCCEQCFETDPHGLLDQFKVIDVADQQREIDNHTRLLAQTVIARGEHATAIRQLQAQVGTMAQAIAVLEAKLERQDEGEKRRLMVEVMTEVRSVVRALPERVQEVEECIVALERKLKLVRRPKHDRPKELGPGA